MIIDFYPFQVCDHVIIDSDENGEILILKEEFCHKCSNQGWYFDYLSRDNGNPLFIDGAKKPNLDLFKMLQYETGKNIFLKDWGIPLNDFIGKKLSGKAIITKIQSEVSNSSDFLVGLQGLSYYSTYLDPSQTIQTINGVIVQKIAPRTVQIRVIATLADQTVFSSSTDFEVKG